MFRLLNKNALVRSSTALNIQQQQICQRTFNSGSLLFKNKQQNNKTQQELDSAEEQAWEQANVDRSTIANQAVPQPASTAIPSSMLAAFNNMFDRGPNVGIEVITKKGFVLSNHIKIDQALILCNGSPFLWNPPPRSEGFVPMKDWDLEAFKIFELVSPRPELIMFGTGKEFAPIPEHVRHFFFKLGIQVDQMNSVSWLFSFFFFFPLFKNGIFNKQ
jgi:NADH dehydrogenase [ubiquinone] 1 alpha subcomplex assembly factor 3